MKYIVEVETTAQYHYTIENADSRLDAIAKAKGKFHEEHPKLTIDTAHIKEVIS